MISSPARITATVAASLVAVGLTVVLVDHAKPELQIQPTARSSVQADSETAASPPAQVPAVRPLRPQETKDTRPERGTPAAEGLESPGKLRALLKTWHSLPVDTHPAETSGPPATLEQYVATLAPEEILDVADSLPEVTPPDGILPVQRMLFRQLAQDAPHTAAGLTESLEPGLPREMIRLEVVLAWAEKDWPAAAGWIARWPSGLTETRTVALRTMRTLLADVDPQTMENWISGLAENPDAAAVLKTALSEKTAAASQRGLEAPPDLAVTR